MAMKVKSLIFLLVISVVSFAQSWQGKPVVRIENKTSSFLYTFSDSSNAYIQKQNISYIVNAPNSVWVQVGYMYDGSTSRIITCNYSALTQPALASAKILSDTLNAWLSEPSTGGGGSGGVQSVVAGTNITVDNTDPENPIVSSTGGGGDSIYYFRTIAQLRTAMSAHTLKKGAKYQATDFQTIYDQPDFFDTGDPKDSVATKTSAVEHLVFTANSDSTFDNYVSSVEYPTDIIKFDWTYTQTEVMNAPAKGRIIERQDDHFNRADYDFRKVLYLRYESSTGSGIFNSWKDNGEASQEFLTIDYNMSFHFVIKDSKITAGLLSKPFILPNIVATGDITAGVTIGSNCRNLTFLAGCTGSEIGDFVSNLTSNSAFNWNYIGGGSTNMSFGGYVDESWLANIDSLTIVGICDNSYIGSCLNSTFGGDFIGNSIRGRIVYCTFGNNFNYNIQYGVMYNCTGGTSFIQNVLYGDNNNLTIGNNSYKCKWWGSSDNIIGNNNTNVDFSNITNLSASNDLSNLKSIVFSSGIDASGWVNFITTINHPEMYLTYPKTVIKTPNGNTYTRYMNNGLTDTITIID